MIITMSMIIIEARGAVRSSLTLGSGSQILGRSPGGVISMMTMIITMSMMITMMTTIGGVEGECVDQRSLVSVLHSPELAGATGRTNSDDEKQLVCIHVELYEPAGVLI